MLLCQLRWYMSVSRRGPLHASRQLEGTASGHWRPFRGAAHLGVPESLEASTDLRGDEFRVLAILRRM
jgi:hypothetical protein